MTITVGSLCSGFESTSLGLQLAGWDHRLAFVADPDPAAGKALAHHHRDVPNLGDISEVRWADVEPVDLLTMGFPCTDVSCAGKRAGLTRDRTIPAGIMDCGCPWADHQILTCTAESWWGASPAQECEHGHIDQAAAAVDNLNERDRLDEDGPPPQRVVKGTRSGVWAHCAEAIAALRPPLVLIENVPGILSTPANRSTDATDSDLEPPSPDLGDGHPEPVLRALGAVLGDLATLRYDTVRVCVSAADIGAPHLRKRIFILAWPVGGEDETRRLLAGVGEPVLDPDGRGELTGALLPTPRASDTGTAGRRASEGWRPPLSAVLLPTPAARLGDRWGTPNAETAARRMGDEGRRNLEDAIALLPTPPAADGDRGSTTYPGGNPTLVGALLPTPKASDSDRGDCPSERTRRSPSLIAVDALLPTPAARDWRSGESNIMDRNARPLNEVVVNLLPTPRATDGTNGGPNQRGSSGDLMLPSAVMLLPTPTVMHTARNATSGRTNPKPDTNTNGWTLSDIAFADRWGDYAPAIARWEQVIGRPAPDPTETGTKGQPRLAPAFVEWMQGLPAGYVTAVPGVSRNDALKLLGNSNPPQMYAAAVRQLAAIVVGLLTDRSA